ncbi:TonB-dependent receptor [Parasphingorhabdus sp.]|uniref:TonB-dependent receptor n=1 Tax=Parasphingorhabdus sp. TaxID=2709688 RepID=UPI002B26CB40|nr:TonB-dependent receptor [Parasphingorhabdus sp.]|tara:strand:- start:1810 stop:4038 length:2229 start_codon:yes stop_codon:yes gene_type:complete
MTNLRTTLLLGTILVGNAFCSAAFAQDGGVSKNDDNIIVVTAQFREQNIQDIPASITAFDALTIEEAGLQETQDFVNLVPNLSLDDSFTYANTFVVVRGVTQVNNADSPLAIVIDGVPQNNQKQFKMDLFDIERIEVLKGPQGALYGRNAIGGAINIVTKQPTNDFEGKLSATIQNGIGLNANAALSGPIVEDKILFRIGGSYKYSDGLIRNIFVNEDVDFIDHDYSVRGKIQIIPSDSSNIDLRASYQNFQAGSSYDVPVRHNADPSIRNASVNDSIFSPNENIVGLTNGEVFDASLKWDVETQIGTVTGISSYTDLKEVYRADIDFSNQAFDPTFAGFAGLLGFFDSIGVFPTPPGTIGVGQGQDLNVELMSQEIRLVSPDDYTLRYILGGYFIHTNRGLRTRLFADQNGQREQIDNTALVFVESNESNSNNAWSIFGQLEFDISDSLTLQGALRYDEDLRKQTDVTSGLMRKDKFTSVQPKVTLTYDVNEDVLLYATYSTGFRSGGFNAPVVTFPTFRDETLTNYETGFKSEFADRRVRLNGSLFFANSKDFQFFFLDLATGQQIIQNLEDVDIWGFEADLQFSLTDTLSLNGGIGYTDTKIKAIGSQALIDGLNNAGVNTASIIGNRTPKTTDWNANLGIQSEHQISDQIRAIFRVDYEYRGHKYWQIDNQDVQDPLHLVNLRGTLTNDNWSLTAFVKNLTNERYYTDFNPGEFLGLAVDLGFPSKPRIYGAEMTFRF